MRLLNILIQSDGTLAWDNVLILLLAVVAGYLIRGTLSKKSEKRQTNQALAEWENKFKQVTNEYKNYRASIESSDRNREKSGTDLQNRVKALEGDIRALSEEKTRFSQKFQEKDEETSRYARQAMESEDRYKTLQENKNQMESGWQSRWQKLSEELTRALSWEQRVRSAEDEAQKARSAIGLAERKKLDAELRLKATSEYAGKVIPLETELNSLREKYEVLELELKVAREAVTEREVNAARLELSRQSQAALQLELETRQNEHTALIAEVGNLRRELQLTLEENRRLLSPAETHSSPAAEIRPAAPAGAIG